MISDFDFPILLTNPMYRIPKDLDLSAVVGEATTQIRVGQFDLQFTFGNFDFAIQSPVSIFHDGELIAHWEEGKWPDSGFYNVMNSEVTHCSAVDDTRIVFKFANGFEMHLVDNWDQYESMQIWSRDPQSHWII